MTRGSILARRFNARSRRTDLIEKDIWREASSRRRQEETPSSALSAVRGPLRMLSYNIDSPETRSQVRLPTIVGRVERQGEKEKEGCREGGR